MPIIRPACVLAMLAACASAVAAAPCDWPTPRQNTLLTSHQSCPGEFKCAPAVLSRTLVSASAAHLRPFASRPGGVHDRALAIADGAVRCYDLTGRLRWHSHPPGLNFDTIEAIEDLDGDSRVEIAIMASRPGAPLGAAVLLDAATGKLRWRYDVEPMSYSWRLYSGNYLPKGIGKQLVVVMHGYPPDKLNGYIVLFEFPGPGKPPVQRWRYDFDHYTCFPSLLQTDLDGDGVKELAVETHSRMWLLDALTGAVKQFILWDLAPANIRSYGLVEFIDLNRDGREDFLCIANFAQHHEVLLNKGGKLERAWAHGWDNSVTTTKIATTWAEPPVADVDGDGRLEIVLSMFNSEKDARWMIRIYDAVTGEIKFRVPDHIAARTADLDGDGRSEILADVSTDATRANVSAAALLRVADGNLQEIWREQGARASDAVAGSKRQRAGAPPQPELMVARGGETFALSMQDGTAALAPYTLPPKVRAADVSHIIPPPVGMPPAPLVCDLDGDGKPEIIHTWGDKTTIYHWNRTRGLEKVREYPASGDPVLADLDRDGKSEIVIGDAAPNHAPIARAYRPDGALLWESRLPEADRAGLPHGRPMYMQVGRFTGKQSPDIYALFGTPLLRSVVLDGLTGKLVWEKGEFPGIERYYGPTQNLASVYDVDRDGADDLVFTNPDYYCVASGRTGDLIVGPAFPPKIFNQPSQGLYTLPAILEQSGKPLVVLADGHYFLGAIGLRAEPLWYQLPEVGQNRSAAEGFLQLPDGRWLIGFGRQNGNFACLDARTGKVLWEMPLQAAAGDTISCDINGDGAVEFIFGDSHGCLRAVSCNTANRRLPRLERSRGERALAWKVNLPASIGSPVIADLDGDGKPEIVAPTGDGNLTVLGNK